MGRVIDFQGGTFMEFLSFFIKGQAKIEARKQKTEQAKQALISEIKSQLSAAQDNSDETNEIKLLLKLGNAYAYYSDFELSDTMYRQGLASARQIPDKHLEAIALINLGLSYKERLDYKQAYSYYQKAARISRELNNRDLRDEVEEHINELNKMLDIDKLSKE
jgi:tetratricopeptide (TPR) repeat protein